MELDLDKDEEIQIDDSDSTGEKLLTDEYQAVAGSAKAKKKVSVRMVGVVFRVVFPIKWLVFSNHHNATWWKWITFTILIVVVKYNYPQCGQILWFRLEICILY